MAKQKKQHKQHIQPLFMLALVLILSGIGAFVYHSHFAPLERQNIRPGTIGEDRIMTAAQKIAPNNEINGIKVRLEYRKQVGDYALVRAVPLSGQTDPLHIVLQQVDGRWQVIASGTAFPELEDKLPEGLFQ
jgi:hypothetical protein